VSTVPRVAVPSKAAASSCRLVNTRCGAAMNVASRFACRRVSVTGDGVPLADEQLAQHLGEFAIVFDELQPQRRPRSRGQRILRCAAPSVIRHLRTVRDRLPRLL
jgi:hypothetical protein